MSWIDRLADWVTGRRVPWWVVVAIAWAGLVFAVNGVKWLDGSLEPWHFEQRLTRDTFFPIFLGTAYGWLRRHAGDAFDRFRPALGKAAGDPEQLRHRITGLPFRSGVVTAVIGAMVGLVALLTDPEMEALTDSSLAALLVIGAVNFVLALPVTFAVVWQSMRQLRLVWWCHRTMEDPDVFRPEPCHAFSRLTARIGGVVIVSLSYAAVTDTRSLENAVWITMTAVGIIGAIAAFLLPLQGVHGHLRDAKDRLRDESAVRMGVVAEQLHAAIDQGHHDQVGDLRTSLGALSDQRARIEAVSTWPWERGTLGSFASTLLVPVLLWFVTSVLGDVLGI
jgi:hypothetical protein